VAEESVVVMKSRPVKPGNRVEEKTGMTFGIVQGAVIDQKLMGVRREEVIFEELSGGWSLYKAVHKLSDETRSWRPDHWGQ